MRAPIKLELPGLFLRAASRRPCRRPARSRPAAAPAPAPVAAVEQKCLRALNGACTNAVSVEEARMLAVVIPASPVSYFGTPAGTVGGDYIPFQRLFQDNPYLYGLPTFTVTTPCCIIRTK